MPNPVLTLPNTATRLGIGTGRQAQIVSDTKYSTKAFSAALAPITTDFFTTAPVADRTLDNYDAGNQLVTSGKSFTIQAISCNVFSATIADIDNVVQHGIIVLTAQGKEIGCFRVRSLNGGGGTFVAGAQVAAASSVGVLNGVPGSDVFRVSELTIATNQSFKAQLIMPTATPVTFTSATTVEIALHGYEARPTA